MAFKLPFTIGCDQPGGCCVEITVYAHSREEANRIAQSHNWKVKRVGPRTLVSPDYRHQCPEHIGKF